ncbi:unnamed protein product [Ixodes pacificus]
MKLSIFAAPNKFLENSLQLGVQVSRERRTSDIISKARRRRVRLSNAHCATTRTAEHDSRSRGSPVVVVNDDSDSSNGFGHKRRSCRMDALKAPSPYHVQTHRSRPHGSPNSHLRPGWCKLAIGPDFRWRKKKNYLSVPLIAHSNATRALVERL